MAPAPCQQEVDLPVPDRPAVAQREIGRTDQAAGAAQEALNVDLSAVDDSDPMTVTPELTAVAGLLSTVGLTAKAAEAQQTVVDLLRGFTPAEADRLVYLISFAEAQHNLIVRLIDDHLPAEAAALAPQTIAAYRQYTAAGVTAVQGRLNRDITDLQKQLRAIGLTAEPVEALQLLVDAFRASTSAESDRLEFQITFAEARHNLIARLIDALWLKRRDHRTRWSPGSVFERRQAASAHSGSGGSRFTARAFQDGRTQPRGCAAWSYPETRTDE